MILRTKKLVFDEDESHIISLSGAPCGCEIACRPRLLEEEVGVYRWTGSGPMLTWNHNTYDKTYPCQYLYRDFIAAFHFRYRVERTAHFSYAGRSLDDT